MEHSDYDSDEEQEPEPFGLEAAKEAGRRWQEWVDAHGDPCAFSWASSKGSVPSASPANQCDNKPDRGRAPPFVP